MKCPECGQAPTVVSSDYSKGSVVIIVACACSSSAIYAGQWVRYGTGSKGYGKNWQDYRAAANDPKFLADMDRTTQAFESTVGDGLKTSKE